MRASKFIMLRMTGHSERRLNFRRHVTAIGLCLALAMGSFAPVQAASGPQPTITPIDGGMLVEWAAQVEQGQVLGFARLRTPGRPRLPVAYALIALPFGAEPSLQILETDDIALALDAPLARAPRPAGVVRDAAGKAIGGTFEAAAEVEPFAPDVLELEELGVMRGVRLARLAFYPARPVGGELRITTRVRAQVQFNAPGLSAAQAASEADPLLSVIRAAVANPETVKAVRSPSRGARGESAQPQNGLPRALIDVNQVGLTALTYEGLSAAGFPLSGDPANLRLTRAGVEVALEWDGDGDASFEPGERLLFYAEPRFNRYTALDVYALEDGGTPGLRMASRSASPSGLPGGQAWIEREVETNALYTPDCLCSALPAGRDGDRWVWQLLVRPGGSAGSYPFSLPSVNAAQAGTLTVWLIGQTALASAAPDHRVNVTLNGTLLGAAEWDGKQAVTATLTIPAGVLQSGLNTLALSLPGLPGVSIEGAWLDAFAVRYARGAAASEAALRFSGEAAPSAYSVALSSTSSLRAYDVTQADQPVRLTNVGVAGSTVTLGDEGVTAPRRYLLASAGGVLAPASVRLAQPLPAITGADYLVITHSAFASALNPLVALRQSQGLSVSVIDVQAIYDAHDGRSTPQAIRAYLEDAYATWTPRPAYVLLVGDGTADPRRYKNDSLSTFIPAYLETVDPWAGETAADNRYVTVDGADALPDMMLGRLPVNTLAEAQTIVNKIVPYETQPPLGWWNAYAGFAADNADPAGDFPAQTQALAAQFIAAPYIAQSIVVSTPVTPTRQAVLARWNSGAGVMLYNGHASIHQWAEERAFHLDDVAGLFNAGRLPVVLQMTCFTGSFQLPSGPVLDEALLRHPNGGAVAAWGPTGLGVATGHELLAQGFLQRVYIDQQPGLGAAALAGKLNLAANGSLGMDLLDTFTLLGDPAMRVKLTMTPGLSVFLPVIRR